MKYTNIDIVKTPQGVEVEGNSLWMFNQHENVMILIANETIKIKPTLCFQRVR
ncbi:hypothetical protein [Algoriella sp.]|uniref:hypothetical protein n=1 Tax=Algoriella sp. TaxID=1872434 RepID=UPI002FC96ABB